MKSGLSGLSRILDDPESVGLLPLLAREVIGHHAPMTPKKRELGSSWGELLVSANWFG